MNTPLTLLIIAFAVYRLCRMLSREDGPFQILETFRTWLGRKASKENKLWITLADLMNCPYCLGVWFSALGALLLHDTSIMWYFIYVLAIAGLQAFLQGLEDR